MNALCYIIELVLLISNSYNQQPTKKAIKHLHVNSENYTTKVEVRLVTQQSTFISNFQQSIDNR